MVIVIICALLLFPSCHKKSEAIDIANVPLILEESTPYKSNAEEDYKFTTGNNDNGITITGYTGKTNIKIEIPPFIQNLPVVRIGERAFYDKSIAGIIIPDSVKRIDDSAFANNRL